MTVLSRVEVSDMSFYSGAVSTVHERINENLGIIDTNTFVYPMFIEARSKEEALGICLTNARKRFPVEEGYVNHNAGVCEVDIISIAAKI